MISICLQKVSASAFRLLHALVVKATVCCMCVYFNLVATVYWKTPLFTGNKIALMAIYMQEVEDECEHYVKLEAIGFDVGKRMLLRSETRTDTVSINT